MDREKEIKDILFSTKPKKKNNNTIYILAILSGTLILSLSILSANNFMIGSSSTVTVNQNKTLNTIKSQGINEYHQWRDYDEKTRGLITAELFALFPSTLERTPGKPKWRKIHEYLLVNYKILHDQPRDILRSNSKNWPRFEAKAIEMRHYIKKYLSTAPLNKLIIHWKKRPPENRYRAWIAIVKPYIAKQLGPNKAELFEHEMLKD